MWLIFFLFDRELSTTQNLSWINYTIEQGLPGNEVYHIMEDSHGYLWFATNQGICRFNGYEFISPIDTSSLRGAEAYIPTEDRDGRILFTRLDGSIWVIENDTIHTWEYNHLLGKFKEGQRPIENIRVDENGSIWISKYNLGFIVVNADGSSRVLDGTSRNGFLYTEVMGKLIYTSKLIGKGKDLLEKVEINQWQDERVSHLDLLPFRRITSLKERGIWKLSSDNYIFGYPGSFYIYDKNQLNFKINSNIVAEEIIETKRGELLIAAHYGKQTGLYYYSSIEDFKHNEYRNLLPGHLVTDVLIDKEGGWWATTSDHGIYYCKNPGFDIYNQSSGLPSDHVVCLTDDGKQSVYAGFTPAAISIMNLIDGTFKVLSIPPKEVMPEIWSIQYDEHNKRLWISNPVFYLEINHWEQVYRSDLPDQKKLPVSAKQFSPNFIDNILLTSAPVGFYEIDALRGQGQLYGSKGDSSKALRTFSVIADSTGTIWVATENGLRIWRNGRYAEPDFVHPALKYQSRDIVFLHNGSMVISLRGNGILIRKKNGKLSHLTTKEGLSSDFITRLKYNQDDLVFACSNNGLNILSALANDSIKITTIGVKEGMPSNQINDVVQLAGQTWVATNRGLVRLRELPESLPMLAPVLEKLQINNRDIAFNSKMRLDYNQNNISIRFYSLHYRSAGDIPYRFRLVGSDSTFRYSHTREVNFANLASGDYTFEVQAQNENRQWGRASIWAFQIRPAWWKSIWFMVLMIASIAGWLMLWYRNRLIKKQKEAEVHNKIRDLEAEALRAQMNPHFIFNCLGSIQHFITENDSASATRYLARFARLVRLALHGSVDGHHSLQDEIDMLDNYLELEQLRFRNKFNYVIESDPGLDKEDIFLPPMLLQPFVENALIHGMKNKEKGGIITIQFSQKESFLIATVTDNGPGYSPKRKDMDFSGNKSLGMTLTQNRLDILSGHTIKDTFTISPVMTENGDIQGTRIHLKIPIE